MTNEAYQEIRNYMKTAPYELDFLTPKQKRVAQLYFLDQHTQKEIAVILGIEQSSVSRAISSVATKCGRYIHLRS